MDYDSIKLAIDTKFQEMLGLSEEDYRFKLVSCTADGASVNFGVYRGLLTQMREEQRAWMLSIHCVNLS